MSFFSENTSSAKTVVSIFLILLIMIFFIANYNFIVQCGVLMNISNPWLVDYPVKYPYDKSSIEYDKLFLIIKIIVAIEYNYFGYPNKTEFPVIALNILIVIVSSFLFFWFVIVNNYFNWHYSLLYVNKNHNLIRKCISLFNFIFILLGLFSFNKTLKPIYIFVVEILSLNLTLVFLFLEHRFLNKHCLRTKA